MSIKNGQISTHPTRFLFFISVTSEFDTKLTKNLVYTQKN
jgi:hypothetical protein